MELSELKELLAQTGLPNQAIEKRLHMGNGIIGKVLKGTYKTFPVHKEKGLRKLAREGEVKQQMDRLVDRIPEDFVGALPTVTPEEVIIKEEPEEQLTEKELDDLVEYYASEKGQEKQEKFQKDFEDAIAKNNDSVTLTITTVEPEEVHTIHGETQEQLDEVMEQLGVVKPYPQVEDINEKIDRLAEEMRQQFQADPHEIKRPDSSLFDLLP